MNKQEILLTIDPKGLIETSRPIAWDMEMRELGVDPTNYAHDKRIPDGKYRMTNLMAEYALVLLEDNKRLNKLLYEANKKAYVSPFNDDGPF